MGIANQREKYVCCCCEEELPATKYYKSYSGLYGSGYLPICKDCFYTRYKTYVGIYNSTKLAIQRMCAAFDVYFNEDLFDSCESETDSATVGKYFRKLNMAQYKNRTFDDNVDEGLEFSSDRIKRKPRLAVLDEYGKEMDEVKRKDVEKWGGGFDPEDYDALNSHYKYLKSANPNSDSNQEIFILELCYTNMSKMKSLREGKIDDYNKLTESYRKSFNQAGLKTTRDTPESKDFIAGVSIATIEKYTPAEFYKDQKLYKDFDGIGGIIKRFFTRPLKNLQFGTNEQDEEYSIQDGDEDE